MNIIDLDILRPEPRIVKIGGREIDVSFVPCGITFELDEIVQSLVKVDVEKLRKDKAEQRRSFDLGLRLCAVFCEHQYPEMNEAWFSAHASGPQVNAFVTAVQTALSESYSAVEAHAKN